MEEKLLQQFWKSKLTSAWIFLGLPQFTFSGLRGCSFRSCDICQWQTLVAILWFGLETRRYDSCDDFEVDYGNIDCVNFFVVFVACIACGFMAKSVLFCFFFFSFEVFPHEKYLTWQHSEWRLTHGIPWHRWVTETPQLFLRIAPWVPLCPWLAVKLPQAGTSFNYSCRQFEWHYKTANPHRWQKTTSKTHLGYSSTADQLISLLDFQYSHPKRSLFYLSCFWNEAAFFTISPH